MNISLLRCPVPLCAWEGHCVVFSVLSTSGVRSTFEYFSLTAWCEWKGTIRMSSGRTWSRFHHSRHLGHHKGRESKSALETFVFGLTLSTPSRLCISGKQQAWTCLPNFYRSSATSGLLTLRIGLSLCMWCFCLVRWLNMIWR